MKKLLFLFLLTFVNFANAQYNPQILINLYNGADPNRGVMNMAFSAQLDNLLFFSYYGDTDFKIYVTDGTPGNTQVLKTVPGYVGLFAFDNHIYYSFVDPVNGTELWKTDGTASGTVLVATLGGGAYTAASDYVIAGNKMFFAAGNTASPTQKQIYSLEVGSNTPVLMSPGLYGVSYLTKFNDRVIFSASETANSNTSNELYITDCNFGPVTASWCLLKDINPGTQGSSPDGFFLYMNKIYFSANDGTHGKELWATDGTETGTQLVMDINPGSADAFYSLNAGITDGILFFAANDGVHGSEVWYSYGTASNTSLLIDLNPTGDAYPNGFVTLGTTLYFAANDGTHGSELWKTNGTAQFTSLVKDINPGQDLGASTIYKSNSLCPNLLFFDANNGGNNVEPWVTDGTAAGTQMIADLSPSGSSLDYETRYVLFNNKIYFAARTGTASELFVMDENCILGIETNQSLAFTIYPNPAKNLINIDTASEIEKIDIYNSLGQRVNSVVGNKKEVDVSTLSNGIYFLNITTTDQFQTVKRIIKE